LRGGLVNATARIGQRRRYEWTRIVRSRVRSLQRSQQSIVAFINATHASAARSMTISVEATYENGVLRPAQPLPLKEQEQVRVTIHRP
jgi:AF2212-like